MSHLRNIAMRDYQESVTTGQTDRQTPDKVTLMCRYALQATQKVCQRDSVFVLLWVSAYACLRVSAFFFSVFYRHTFKLLYMTLSGHLNMFMNNDNIILIKTNQPLSRKLHPSLNSKSLRAERTRGPRAFYRSPDNQQQTVQSDKKTTRMTGFK